MIFFEPLYKYAGYEYATGINISQKLRLPASCKTADADCGHHSVNCIRNRKFLKIPHTAFVYGKYHKTGKRQPECISFQHISQNAIYCRKQIRGKSQLFLIKKCGKPRTQHDYADHPVMQPVLMVAYIQQASCINRLSDKV